MNAAAAAKMKANRFVVFDLIAASPKILLLVCCDVAACTLLTARQALHELMHGINSPPFKSNDYATMRSWDELRLYRRLEMTNESG